MLPPDGRHIPSELPGLARAVRIGESAGRYFSIATPASKKLCSLKTELAEDDPHHEQANQ
jgi:hypothetical protein